MAIDEGTRLLVGYVRVSSVAGRDELEEAFKSPDVQKDAMKQWAKARYGNKHRWLDWFIDLDTSGSTHDRPLLNKASDLAIQHNADLIVYNFSRYSRNLPEGLTALRRLQERGVSVYAAAGGVSGGTAEDDLTLAMFLMMNQYHLAKIAEGWQQVIRRNKDEGRWHGIVPFGYRRANEQELKKLGRRVGVIVPDKTNAPHVRRLFTLYSQGAGLFELGELGKSKKWFSRNGTAKDILSNPAYIGKLPVKQYVTAINKETNERRLDKHLRPLKEVVRNAEVTYVDGLHEPIVTEELWNKVQARLLKEKRAPRTKYTAPRFFAARRVRCAACRRPLTFQPMKSGNYLTCPNRNCSGRPGAVKLVELESIITEFIHHLPLIVEPALSKALKERSRDANAVSSRKASLDRSIEKLSRNRENLAEMLALDEYPHKLTADDVGAALAKTNRDLSVARKDRLELELQTDAVPEIKRLKREVVEIGKIWDLASVSQRLAILKSLSIEIRVTPSRKHNDALEGRVIVATGLPTGSLEVVAGNEKSGSPKRPRLS